ncbi:MAG TPA: hypothetical protein VGM41_08350 [Chitinophagaceae bacterium]
MGEQYSNYIKLNFSYPGGGIIGPFTVADMSEAKRLLYFHTRNYILDKLKGWLNQRIRALTAAGEYLRADKANELQQRLINFTDTSFFRLADFLIKQESKILFVAPGQKSRNYNYYHDNILPILEYCREMKEGVVA